MKWKRGLSGWISEDGRWRIRGPIMGHKMFWLYKDHSRYTTTDHYDDAVNFESAKEAKRFVDHLLRNN